MSTTNPRLRSTGRPKSRAKRLPAAALPEATRANPSDGTEFTTVRTIDGEGRVS